jgi:hypothetical protein
MSLSTLARGEHQRGIKPHKTAAFLTQLGASAQPAPPAGCDVQQSALTVAIAARALDIEEGKAEIEPCVGTKPRLARVGGAMIVVRADVSNPAF